MTEEEIAKHKATIDQLDHETLCRVYRFGEPGHRYFQHSALWRHFYDRLMSFGGMDVAISKAIGFENTDKIGVDEIVRRALDPKGGRDQ